MGLGKTIEALAAMERNMAKGAGQDLAVVTADAVALQPDRPLVAPPAQPADQIQINMYCIRV